MNGSSTVIFRALTDDEVKTSYLMTTDQDGAPVQIMSKKTAFNFSEKEKAIFDILNVNGSQIRGCHVHNTV